MPNSPSHWTSRRILKEIADADTRRLVLTDFWKHAEPQARLVATVHLAKALHFRDETLRKMPPEKKADLLASRIGVAEFDDFLDVGLMQYHTHRMNEMMAAFLDRWQVPHVNGAIETDDYKAPSTEQVRDAVTELEGTYSARAIALYLASAAVLMGDDWRASISPVVDEMAAKLA